MFLSFSCVTVLHSTKPKKKTVDLCIEVPQTQYVCACRPKLIISFGKPTIRAPEQFAGIGFCSLVDSHFPWESFYVVFLLKERERMKKVTMI